jgi:hypothetical protein
MTPEDAIRIVLGLIQGYLILGALFALAFVTVLGPRLDPSTKGASIGFRIIIFPSITLLWPLLYTRWVRERTLPTECNAHRGCARSGSRTPEVKAP